MERRPKSLMLAQAATAIAALAGFGSRADAWTREEPARPRGIHRGQKVLRRRRGWRTVLKRRPKSYKGSPAAKRATKRGGNPAVYG